MAKFSIIILFLVVTWHDSFAVVPGIDEQYVPVTIYTTKDGLPSQNIQDIIEDEDGFIWLATQEGLSRFDSSKFVNFSKNKTDDYSLPDLLVEDLMLMPDGELWMSINEVGIAIFDKFSHKFTSIKNAQSALFKMPNQNLYGIAKDRNNNIWFSLYGTGLYQWNISENRFYKHQKSDENAWLTSALTFEIMVDSKNRLWVCTIDSKVYYYDIDTGESKTFNFSTDSDDLLSSPIYGFTESSKGEIFAGGYSGVFKFNESSSSFENLVSKSTLTTFHAGKRLSVRRLMVDSRDNLWIGTTKSLLQFSENKLKKIKFYENGEAVGSNKSIHSIIEDSSKNIWIGTEGLGLVKISSDWNRYNVHISDNNEPMDIRGAYQNKDKLWIFHTSPRIEMLGITDDKITIKSSFVPDLGASNLRLYNLFQDSENKLWASSVNGIYKIDIETGESSIILNKEGKKIGSVKVFFKADDNNYYFNLFGENIIGYFNENEMVAQYIENTPSNNFKGSIINQMIKGLDNKLWMATDYGVESLDIESKLFGSIYKSPIGKIVSHLFFTPDDTGVWMIEDGALYHLKWNGLKLLKQEDRYSDILPLVNFDRVKSYKDDVLMIATEDNGIVEINTKSLEHSVYTSENGLPSDVIKDVMILDESVLIVTELGVALENRNYEEQEQITPKVIIDNVSIGDMKIPFNSSDVLKLGHDYGSLNLDIALLSFNHSSSVEYEYKLLGVSDTWISTGADNKYSFLNQSSGKYTFVVRGRSNFGMWSTPEKFSFTVEPPPSETWWAYTLYALGILGVFYWFLYIYKRKILYEHEITKQQTQKHIANAASKAKSDFLARVSHEVRTPLNGVLGMGELMLDTPMDEEQQIYADSIMASGRHLLDIINDILDLSKIEAGKMELENEPFNLLFLVDEIIAAFSSQAKEKELLFTCHFDNNLEVHRVGDVIRIKQILFNLLSNAFKFTKQGQVKLLISSLSNDDSVVFSIVDTGIGVDEKTIEDLFKPFVQADSAITRKFGGTGLGLAIVKQLTEKMDGQIKVKGMVDVGSTFTVDLMLIKDTAIGGTHQLTPEPKEFCVLMQHEDLQESLHHYFERLNIQYTNQINGSTQCLLVDVLFAVSDNQIKTINKAIDQGVDIVFIGFDLKAVNNIASLKNIPIKLLSPPVTYKKLQQICNDPETSYEKAEVLQETAIQKTLNLLVVEDNAINQQVSIEMLEKMGHWVDIIDSAEEALIMLNRSKYDLLLVDYHLPGMDGLSMVKIWDNVNQVPVIVVTADLTDELYSRCNKLGITNIVAKPFTQRVLSEAIAKAIENSQQI